MQVQLGYVWICNTMSETYMQQLQEDLQQTAIVLRRQGSVACHALAAGVVADILRLAQVPLITA